MSVITFGKPHQSYQGKSRPVLWWLSPDLAHYVLDCAPTLHRLPLPHLRCHPVHHPVPQPCAVTLCPHAVSPSAQGVA